MIEGGAEVGGLCILRGCMPTKALLYSAEVLHLAQQAEQWGIRIEKCGFDFAKVMARKNALIQEFADYRREQLAGGKFKFIRAHASFLDPRMVAVSNAGLLSLNLSRASLSRRRNPRPGEANRRRANGRRNQNKNAGRSNRKT